jgi:hypothetical protein
MDNPPIGSAKGRLPDVAKSATLAPFVLPEPYVTGRPIFLERAASRVAFRKKGKLDDVRGVWGFAQYRVRQKLSLERDDFRLIQRRRRGARKRDAAIQESPGALRSLDRHVASLLAMTIPCKGILL